MANEPIDANVTNSLADLKRLKANLLEAADAKVTLDVSQARKLSMLQLQLFLAAKSKFASEGRSLAFTQASSGLLDTLGAAGLGEMKDELCKDAAA